MVARTTVVDAKRSDVLIRVGFLIPPGMPELRDFITSLIPLLHECTKPYVDFADIGPPQDSGEGFLVHNGFDPKEAQRQWDRCARKRSPAIVASEQTLEVMKVFNLKIEDLPAIQVAFAPAFGNPVMRRIPDELCLTPEGRLLLRDLLRQAFAADSIERWKRDASRRAKSLRRAFECDWDRAVVTAGKTLAGSATKPVRSERVRSRPPPPRGWMTLDDATAISPVSKATVQRWVTNSKNKVETRKDGGRLLVKRSSYRKLLARKRRS